MKRVRVGSRSQDKRKKSREPLAEGIRKRRPRGFFTKMSDDELVAYAKRVMEEEGISGKRDLMKADMGLYLILGRRKLLGKIDFEERHRNWSSLSDAQLVEHTRQFMEENGISGRKELYEADIRLYDALRRRKLLDKVGFKEKLRAWNKMSDKQLVAFTREFMKANGIDGRRELVKADNGLYQALQIRKLLGRIGFEERQRDWSSLSDAQLVEHTRQFLEENGISGRKELSEADGGLYDVLRKRKLLDRVGFEEKRRKQRDWSSLSDAQLIEHTRQFMEENGISGRSELKKADRGLYETLRIRNLLDRVFADIEQTKEREEAQALFDGLMEFGGAG